jgi:hypothetical protein
MMIKICKTLVFLLFLLCRFSAFSQTPDADEVFAPFVSRLTAEVKNGFIRLSWEDSPVCRGEVFIYRSESPMDGASADGLPLPIEVPYGAKSYVDEADRTGTLYFFAAASDERGQKYMLTIPYTNTVNISVEESDLAEYYRESVPSVSEPAAETGVRELKALTAQAEEDRVRTMPLPRMESRGTFIPSSPESLRPDALNAITLLVIPAVKTEKDPEPFIFPEDLAEFNSGEEYQIGRIVQDSFSGGNWEKAGEEFRRFLAFPRSPAGQYRARFYLGQVYYFSGNTREALFEFLAAGEQFPRECDPWVQAVLKKLESAE